MYVLQISQSVHSTVIVLTQMEYTYLLHMEIYFILGMQLMVQKAPQSPVCLITRRIVLIFINQCRFLSPLSMTMKMRLKRRMQRSLNQQVQARGRKVVVVNRIDARHHQCRGFLLVIIRSLKFFHCFFMSHV